MANHKHPNKDRILKNGCYYDYEGSKMVVAINTYGMVKTNNLKSDNYEALRYTKDIKGI